MVKGKFTSAEKARIILEFFTTNIHIAELCRKHNLPPQTFYQWRDRFVEGGKASLNGTPNGDVCSNLQKENDSLKKLIGEITIANDILKKKRWRIAKDDCSERTSQTYQFEQVTITCWNIQDQMVLLKVTKKHSDRSYSNWSGTRNWKSKTNIWNT